MNKKELETLISENLTVQQIADKVGKSKSTIEVALVKFGLKPHNYHDSLSKERKCRSCGKVDFTKNFPNALCKGKIYYRWKCRKCYVLWQSKYKWDQVDWLEEQKKQCSCAQCGEDDFRVLDFHHESESDKSFGISEGAWRVGRKRLIQEMEKCRILCSNCHRKLTYDIRAKKGYRNKGFNYFFGGKSHA